MADQIAIVVSGDSREAVAYALFLGIARHEKKNIFFSKVTLPWFAEVKSGSGRAVSHAPLYMIVRCVQSP